jgi:hypothetical protein
MFCQAGNKTKIVQSVELCEKEKRKREEEKGVVL